MTCSGLTGAPMSWSWMVMVSISVMCAVVTRLVLVQKRCCSTCWFSAAFCRCCAERRAHISCEVLQFIRDCCWLVSIVATMKMQASKSFLYGQSDIATTHCTFQTNRTSSSQLQKRIQHLHRPVKQSVHCFHSSARSDEINCLFRFHVKLSLWQETKPSRYAYF